MRVATIRCWVLGLCFTIPGALLAAPIQDGGKNSQQYPAEKTRKALQETVTIEIKEKTLDQAIGELKEKTKLNLVLDHQAIALDPTQQQWQQWQQLLPPGAVQPGVPGQAAMVTLNAKDMKIRDALQQILAQENLTYVILGEQVLITTEAMSMQRQLKQHVSLDLDAVPFNQAIKQLARETGANLLVDNKLKKEVETAVSLQIEDVPLDTAVRLLAEAAGLKPVRMGNVIYLTNKANANELRADPELSGAGQQQQQAEIFRLQQQINGINLGGLIQTAPALPVLPPPPAPAPGDDEKKDVDKKVEKKEDK
jgi:type II secretory pathway component GspD/PulD (secretin)